MGEKGKRTKVVAMMLLMPVLLFACIWGSRTEVAGQEPSVERTVEATGQASSVEKRSAEATGQASSIEKRSAEATDPAKDSGEKQSQDSGDAAKEQSRVTISLVGKYDSADTAVIYKIRPLEGTITFRNYETGRNYTLNYDPASHFIGVYEQEISVESLKQGDLCEVTFLKSNKHLNCLSLKLPENAWSQEHVTNYTLPERLSFRSDGKVMARLPGGNYILSARTLILIDGKPGLIENILQDDVLHISGVGHEVYCIQVERGHGYVSLSETEVNGHTLIGAWIQLDRSLICKITDQMLLTAPEGTYTCTILGNGANFETPLTVKRNAQTILDVSGISFEEGRSGKMRFEVLPEDAKITVDGEEIRNHSDQELAFGVHTILLTREGYQDSKSYLKVGSRDGVVRLSMEKTEPEAGNARSGRSDASSSGSSYQTQGDNSTSGNFYSAQSGNSASGNLYTAQSGNSASGNFYSALSGNAGSGQGTVQASLGMSAIASGENFAGTASSGNQVGTPRFQGEKVEGSKVFIDAPREAVLYLDGSYIGMTPLSFDKITGNHTITLHRDGYKTVSYNILLDGQRQDKTYRFPDLLKQ